MRRFLLFVFVSCTAASVALSLWPRQLGGYLAMFGQHTSVNRGLAATVLAVLTVALVALQLRLWRSRRDLARARRGLEQPPAYGWPPPPWGSRPAR
jgi:hypothetical protein